MKTYVALIRVEAQNPQHMSRYGNRTIIVYANSKGLGEPAHPRSLAGTCAVRSHKRKDKGKLQPKN